MPIEEKGSAEEIDRLKRERDEADRLYNEALTKLDAAIQTPRDVSTSAFAVRRVPDHAAQRTVGAAVAQAGRRGEDG